jgi:hypothetical protein
MQGGGVTTVLKSIVKDKALFREALIFSKGSVY